MGDFVLKTINLIYSRKERIFIMQFWIKPDTNTVKSFGENNV